MSDLGRVLIVVGVVVALAGLLLSAFGSWLPLGRLPGDLRFGRGGFSVGVLLGTSLLLSVVLTIVANIVIRLLNR